MRRVVHSSKRSSIKRHRRNGAFKRSQLLSVRCGLLVIAGGLLLMFLEFIVLHRHDTDMPDFIDKPNSSRGTVTGDRRRNSRDGKAFTLDSARAPKTQAFSDSNGKPKATKTREKPGDSVLGSTLMERLPPRDEHRGDEAIADRLEKETKFDYDGMRVAVLVPYSGPGLPLWFDAFTDLAAASRDAVDWIIFCEEELAQVKTPSNVRMISTSPVQLAWLLARIVYPEDADEKPDEYVSEYDEMLAGELTEEQEQTGNERLLVTRFIQKLLLKNPYYMVEFKPALGWVFREFLDGYTHWAYGDLDVFFGDLTKGWLEPSEMRDFDIITYSFGDQHRAYLRGQLTVHKIKPNITQLWRGCPHLSSYLRRIENTYNTKQYNLESAEGCYSMVVMMSQDTKVKYAVKVFTDMPGGGHENQEEVVISGDAVVKRCPAQLQRRGDIQEPEYGRMQEDVGEEWPIQITQESCEYWINPRFQTCLDIKHLSPNVFLHDGKFYARDYVNLWAEKTEDDCSLGAFHHFQDFKANYKAWNTRPPMPPVHRGMVASDGGIVPLPNGDWRSMAVQFQAPPPENRDRFTPRYCLRWEEITSKTPRSYKATCEVSVTEHDVIRTLHDTRPAYARSGAARIGDREMVTLGGVGSLRDLPTLLKSCHEWRRGPKVLILILRSSEIREVTKVLELEQAKGEGAVDDTFVRAFVVPNTRGDDIILDEMPRKTLLNALGDSCQTRYLLTMAPGFRLARGVETAVIKALETPLEKPRVLVIPQWCLKRSYGEEGGGSADVISSLSFDDIQQRHREGTANLCHRYEREKDSLWVGSDVMDKFVEAGDAKKVDMARRRGETESEDTRLTNGRVLLSSNVMSPVIVVDMWSAPALFLRHVEEVTRPRCFDGAYARGLWAAGFEFHMLPDTAVLMEASQPKRNCRSGSDIPMVAYASFLQDVRRVYSQTVISSNMDDFKLSKGDKPFIQAKSRMPRKRWHSKQFRQKEDMYVYSVGDVEPTSPGHEFEADLGRR